MPVAAPHQRLTAFEPPRVDADPDAEHQLVALVLGLDCFRDELRLAGDEHDLGRDDVVGISIEHDAGLRPDPDPAGFRGRQVNVHVDIGSI
jgi:hypothetical protein